MQKDQEAVSTADASLSSTELKDQQSLQQAQAQVTAAQLQLSEAKTGVSSDQVGEPSQVASDQATVAVDQVSLAQAKTNLADASLTSPIAGTVVDVNLSDGQSVTAGATTVSAANGSVVQCLDQ